MCKANMYPFLSGFIVGMLLCLCIIGLEPNLRLIRKEYDKTQTMGVPLDVSESLILLRTLRKWFATNEINRGRYEGNKLPEALQHPNNKTVFTCIVPLLGGQGEFSQLDSEIIATWVHTCNHVVFLRSRSASKTDSRIQKTLEKLQSWKQATKIASIRYFYVSTPADNMTATEQFLRSQFKAVVFASEKYADSSLFIITPNTTEVRKYICERLNEDSRASALDSLKKVLTTSDTLDSKTVLIFDRFSFLGQKVVSRLSKMTDLNRCSFKNQRLFSEWAHQCIKTANGK